MKDRNSKNGAPGSKGRPSLAKHPLFPAMVAIWFGALFGLGSLAIRPTLLESLVVSSRIDLLVPAAAPPLGMTARILLALVMAGAGGLLGANIARRIARPRPEKRERSRSAASVLGRQTPAGDVGRRRPLTIDEPERDEFEERAPLPGGSPQILNVHDVDIDEPGDAGFDADRAGYRDPAPAIVSPAQVGIASASPASTAPDNTPVEPDNAEELAEELDLAAFSSGESDPGHAPAHELAAAPAELPRFKVQSFAPEPNADEVEMPLRPFAAPAVAAAPAAATAQFPRVPDSAPLARLGSNPASEDGEDAYRTDAEMLSRLSGGDGVARRLFDAPPSEDDGSAPQSPEIRTGTELSERFEDMPQKAAAPLSSERNSVRIDHPTVSKDQAVKADATDSPDALAASRIEAADLGELSQVELLERLALALRARRERKAEPVRTVSTPSPAIATVPVLPPLPERPASAATAEPVAAPQLEMSAVPVSTDQSAIAALPAALRPVDLDGFDDGEDIVPDFVPARHIAMSSPAPVPAAIDRPVDVDEVPFQTEAGFNERTGDEPADWTSSDAEDDEGEESRVLEDGYSSLLNLSRPAAVRQQFVRIDEPEDTGGAIEPVVIFPGQNAGLNASHGKPIDAPVAPTPATRTGESAPVARPFDAPGTGIAQGVPAPAVAQDPEETERALRAALASLQRMSGAA